MNNTPFDYDSPKTLEMELFLNNLLRIVKDNPGVKINHVVVYRLLCNEGLSSSDRDKLGKGILVANLFEKWNSYFNRISNVSCFFDFNNPNFFRIFNGNMKDTKDFIKLYIPMKSDIIDEGIKRLFTYLAINNITHESAVSRNMRNDNVVIRLRGNDFESYNKIMNYLANNGLFKNGLNNNNPFVPTINGIGVIKDYGASYNYEMASLISDYLNKNLDKKYLLTEDFVRELSLDNTYDNENTKRIFLNSLEPNNNVLDKKEVSNEKLILILKDALRFTFNKYGYEHTFIALEKALLQNDFSWFTNADAGFRTLLVNSFNSVSLKKLLNNFYNGAYNSPEEYISNFIDYSLGKEMNAILSNACISTYDKYGKKQLISALLAYMNTGNANLFSRSGHFQGINYREELKKLSPYVIFNFICRFLDEKGISYEGATLDIIVDKFVDSIIKENVSVK